MIHSDASRIGIASLVLVVGFLGSRALGVVRNMALAQTFGAGAELDAYFAAFRLPDLLFQLLVGSVLGSAFLPTFTRYFTTVSPRAAWRLASATLATFSGAGVFAGAAGFVAAPWVVPATVPGFAPEQQQLTVELTRIMLLSTVAFCASGMVTGILNSRSHFLLPALAPWLYNACIIGAVLLLGPATGVAAAAWGVAVGALLHLLVQLPGLRRIGMQWSVASHRTPGVGAVLRLMGPRVVALGAAQVNWLALTLLGSGLAAGSVTALNYGWALAMLPLGLFGMAPATAAFPALAAAAARADWEAFAATLAVGLRMMLFLAIPASVGLVVVGEPLIELLFERGEFEAGATAMAAAGLSGFSVGLFAHVTQEIASRASYALEDTRTPLFFALGSMVANVAMGLALAPLLGVAGLALGMSLATVAEALGLLTVVTRRIPSWRWKPVVRSVALTAAGTVVMGLVAVAALWLVEQATAHPLARTVVPGAAGGAAYLVAMALVGSPEFRLLLARARRQAGG